MRELERRGDALERECARLEAKLTPRQRALVEAQWVEQDPDTTLLQ